LPQNTLTLVIGAVILFAGVYLRIFINHVFPYRSWKMLLLAAVASFNKSISGGGYGPLMTSGQVLSGVETKAAVAITSLAEGLTCLLGVLLFFGEGRQPSANLLVPVCVGALLSVPFSAAIVRKVDEGRMKTTVAYVTIILGAVILLKVKWGG
ncbi:MAG: sulfite exporter TauE/SafE family protein, partial [bacterium]